MMHRPLGKEPNFMITKGTYKLIITKLANSTLTDMMFDHEQDPYEMNNLLTNQTTRHNLDVIGKAEHLKALLYEWMVSADCWLLIGFF